MPTIVAIGGGELKDLETLPIDREIVRLARKKKPRVLFIPTASNDALGYCETFRTVYENRLKCEVEELLLIREKLSKKTVAEKIFSADIIYVGGGNTLKMLRVWRKRGVDVLLKQVYKKDVVLSGLSAGALCWFRYGSSDARSFSQGKQFSYMRVRGLELVSATASPHHIREKTRDGGLERILRRTSGIGLAIDDNAALVIEGNQYRVIASAPVAKVRRVCVQAGKAIWEIVPKSGSMSVLLQKPC